MSRVPLRNSGLSSDILYPGVRQVSYRHIPLLLGLILVTVGVYSVLAYATARKTHEIGIRMALGAKREDVLRLVIRAGLRLVTAGVAIGLFMSLLLEQSRRSCGVV
jgi:predicted lysophospholipase L1 biosynthesis ABC-type transport system permease subunit